MPDSYIRDDYYLDKEVVISLSNAVKNKISEKFGERIISDFIEANFPPHQTHQLHFFKMKGKRGDEVLALKVPTSPYMFLIRRSVDNHRGSLDNYFLAFDIQKREEIDLSADGDFIKIDAELYIPSNFNRRFSRNRGSEDVFTEIERAFKYLKPYEQPRLDENQNFQKWYSYLTLMEKLVDAKDFFFEAEVSYSKSEASVEIEDSEIFQKLKKAKGEYFNFYEIGSVDTSKPVHEWDEHSTKNREFGVLNRKFNSQKITFKLDDKFIKKFRQDAIQGEERKKLEDELESVNENRKKEIQKELDKKITNFPQKLILRVNYFREQFQLRTLKYGMDKIQRHHLKEYLFGDSEIEALSESDWADLPLEFLSKQLNEKQQEAVRKAIASRKLFMIQGPPGTGKTEVISEIAYQEAITGKKVLISSQANMAVDNAIQRLNSPELYPVRIIRKDYEPEDGESLPVEANISTFYQDRIVRELSDEVESKSLHKEILEEFFSSGKVQNFDEFITIISAIGISLPSNLDLNNEYDRGDLFRIVKSSQSELESYYNSLDNEYMDIQKRFTEELKESLDDDEKSYLKNSYLKSVNIWGATLFEVGKYSFNDKPCQRCNFDTVIIDEVSKAMPPELILPILRAEKVILVGDHKQLPPIIKDVSLEDIAKESGVSVEMLDFEKTIFEDLIERNPNSFVMLDTQYRMHPHIQGAINQFYGGGLKSGLTNPDFQKAHHLEEPIFYKKHLVWLRTGEEDLEEKEGTSFKNSGEVDRIQKSLEFLNREYGKIGKVPTVGVITFYGRQLGALKQLEVGGFWKKPLKDRNFPNLDIRFGTVDRFQGQEKDIIIVSLVRNNRQRNVGFAKKSHRVNVAFSRAKNLLIIVGNPDNFAFGRDSNSSELYSRVLNVAKKFGSVIGGRDV
jgi:superfamily I DNA and/or RNA helicase